MTQAWWTSKTFWTMLVGFILSVLVLAGILPATADTAAITAVALTVLGMIFRWTASGPLTK
jgi:hypothetical protein